MKRSIVAFAATAALGLFSMGALGAALYFAVWLHWHPRLDSHPEHIWLRGQMAEVIAALEFDQCCQRYRVHE